MASNKKSAKARRKEKLERQIQRNPERAAEILAQEEARRKAAQMKKGEREQFLAKVAEDPIAHVQEAPQEGAKSEASKRASTTPPSVQTPRRPRAAAKKPRPSSREVREKRRKMMGAGIIITVIVALILTMTLTLLPGNNPTYIPVENEMQNSSAEMATVPEGNSLSLLGS